ncbi:hypothetical protein [Aerococcus viridans]|uniref:hypothetical protein n=1 Tax=Aerococcus viridans TaxID=1377 RepID=UPI00223B6072|nr:hypothetical protein [Aerococcus viridans]MCT1797279.1 hypothetical protein [Aerococcus viridans]
MFDQYRYPELLDQYHGVIVHVLNRYRVDVYKAYYDDVYQLAQIALYQAAEEFDGDPLSEADRYRFVAYVKRVMAWRVLDELRKHTRLGGQEFSTTDEWVFEAGLGAGHTIEITADIEHFLAEAAKILQHRNLDFLYQVIACQGKTKLLLEIYPISRQAIYYKKRNLMDKLQSIRHLLVG